MSDEKQYRDAVTGEYVTEEYAKKHPRRTVGETRHEPEHEEPAEPAPEEEEN